MLSCITCNKAYVGQTSWSLKLRYKEHARYIKGNNPQSAYALHILNNQHEYGPIEKTMTLLKPLKNTSLLTPYELLSIQSYHKAGKLILEQNPSKQPTAPASLRPFPLSHKTRLVEQQLSHSAHSLWPSSTRPQPAQPGMYSTTKSPPPLKLTQPVFTPALHLLKIP
jgi:hypothetical protein